MTVSLRGAPTAGKPLSGLRVIEVATFVAGPLGGMTLAQLGADVIRIDPLGGAADYTRWPVAASGTSLYWAGLNKGKRSMAADFRSAEGRGIRHQADRRVGSGRRHRADQRGPSVAELRGAV
jgi:2-methylfumaryl-CoA isomerase